MVSPTGGRRGKRGQTPFTEGRLRRAPIGAPTPVGAGTGRADDFVLSINGKQLIPAVEKLGLCARVFLDASFFTFRWAVDFCSSGGARAGDMVAGWVGGGCGYGK